VQLAQGRARKEGPIHARYGEPVLDVGRRILGTEGIEMITGGNALIELSQARVVQHIAQLRLSHQEDLQQLVFGRLQIGQQADLLQDPR
jgi:hypothetical protein